MGDHAEGSEDVEMVGGPMDGQLIRYAAGDAPRRFLVFGRDRPRRGPTCVYVRTGDRTRGGATVFRLAGPDEAGEAAGSAG